jgi:hypothetical protein
MWVTAVEGLEVEARLEGHATWAFVEVDAPRDGHYSCSAASPDWQRAEHPVAESPAVDPDDSLGVQLEFQPSAQQPPSVDCPATLCCHAYLRAPWMLQPCFEYAC